VKGTAHNVLKRVEGVCTGFECLKEDVDDVVRLFSEIILTPALPQQKIEIVRAQVREPELCAMHACKRSSLHMISEGSRTSRVLTHGQ
jgi:hypothetical protein